MSPWDEPSRGSHGPKCGQAPWEQRRGREKAPGPESRVFLSTNLRDRVAPWRCGRLAVPCGVASSVPARVTASGAAHPASGPLQGRLRLSETRGGRGGGEGSGRLSRGVLVYSLRGDSQLVREKAEEPHKQNCRHVGCRGGGGGTGEPRKAVDRACHRDVKIPVLAGEALGVREQ